MRSPPNQSAVSLLADSSDALIRVAALAHESG